MKKYSYLEAISFFEELPHFAPPINTGVPLKDMFSLDAEQALLEKLGNPHNDLKYVHVAGTNGKGSTVAYISSVLDKAGIKVGTFASPFLFRYNEMFVVNGKEISDDEFAKIFSEVKPAYDELASKGIYPSEYEILTVMGFVYFKEMKCDLVVLEVSMGGRVDTTNVILAPIVTVITPISYDHMSILGNTLAEIASEKAGIIKAGTVVVSASQEKEVSTVLEEAAARIGVGLIYGQKPKVLSRSLKGQVFELDEKYETSLLGTYQVDNAALAILAVKQLRKRGYAISDAAIAEGIRVTKWFGRFSLTGENPYVIVDGGHNRQGAEVLRQSLEQYFPNQKIVFLMGILKDKEVDIILEKLMPIAKRCYVEEVPNKRTMTKKELVDKIGQYGIDAVALEKGANIKDLVRKDEVLCICGSLYLIEKYYSYNNFSHLNGTINKNR